MSTQDLATALKTILGPRFDKIEAIGRDTIANDDNIKYFPSDNEGLFAYVVFDSDIDYDFDSVALTSRGGSYFIKSDLALYIFGCCKNIDEILLDAVRALNFLSDYEVIIKDATTNKEQIIGETRNNALRAAKIRFSAKWAFNAECSTPDINDCITC